MDAAREPSAGRTTQRGSGLLLGSVIGLGALVVTAYLVGTAASMAHASFSGCWTACGGTRNPVGGTVWVVVAAALLAAPIGVALRVARVRSRAAWAATALVVAAAAAAWAAFSLDPANADFFVRLGE